MAHRTTWHQLTAPLILCALITALLGPVLMHPATSLPGEGDPLLMTWMLLHQKTHADTHPLDAPFLYPYSAPLALTEPVLALRLLALGLRAILHEPLAVYNILTVLGFLLTALATYIFVFELTSSPRAAFIAALIVTINPYRWFHLPRLQLLHFEGFPLTFWALWRGWKRQNLWWWAAAAGFVFLQWTLCIYYAIFLTPMVIVTALSLALRRPTGPMPNPKRRILYLSALGTGLIIGIIIGLSIFLFSPYIEWQTYLREPWPADQIRAYSARISDFFVGIGPLRPPGSHHRARIEGFLFPGYLALVLAGLGFLHRRSPVFRFGALFTGAGLLLSFGPSLFIYTRLQRLYPLLSATRAPIRWHAVTLFGVALLAAAGIRRLEGDRTRFPFWGTVLLIGGLLAGTWQRPPWQNRAWLTVVHPIHEQIRRETDPDAPVITLPSWTNYGPMSIILFWQLQHRHPITGGLVPRFPRGSIFLFDLFQRLPRPEVLDAMRVLHIRHIIFYPYLAKNPRRIHRLIEHTQKTWRALFAWQKKGKDYLATLTLAPSLPTYQIPSRSGTRSIPARCYEEMPGGQRRPLKMITDHHQITRVRWKPGQLNSIICTFPKWIEPVFVSLYVGTHNVVGWEFDVPSASGTWSPLPVLRWDIATSIRHLPWIREPAPWHRPVKLYLLPEVVTDRIRIRPDSNHRRHPVAIHEIHVRGRFLK